MLRLAFKSCLLRPRQLLANAAIAASRGAAWPYVGVQLFGIALAIADNLNNELKPYVGVRSRNHCMILLLQADNDGFFFTEEFFSFPKSGPVIAVNFSVSVGVPSCLSDGCEFSERAAQQRDKLATSHAEPSRRVRGKLSTRRIAWDMWRAFHGLPRRMALAVCDFCKAPEFFLDALNRARFSIWMSRISYK
jgi:hypothetical protein